MANALESSQVAHHGLEHWRLQRVKPGHSRRWDSGLENAQSFLVGQPLHFRACGDIGSALAASPVQAVAGCTDRIEQFAPIRHSRTARLIFSGRGMSLLRLGRHEQCASSKDCGKDRCTEKAVRGLQDESCPPAGPGAQNARPTFGAWRRIAAWSRSLVNFQQLKITLGL